MLAALFAAVLPGAIIAVQVEEQRGVTGEEARAILSTLKGAIEARVHEAEVLFSDAVRLGCPSDQRCPRLIRERTSAERIVYVRMIGIPSLIRFIAELDAGGELGPAASGDAARDSNAISAAIAKITAALFPQEPPILELRPRVEPPPLEARKPVGPIGEPEAHALSWMLFGASAIMIGTGVAFGLVNKSARDEGMMTTDPGRIDELKTKTLYSGLIADFSFLLAIAGISTGVVLLLTE
jgi:hypothetical protein